MKRCIFCILLSLLLFGASASGAWTKLDDRDASVTYTGTWDNVSQSQAYNGTTKFSYPNGIGFSFAFTGTGVRFYSFDCDGGDVDISIDGQYQTTVNTSGSCNASVLKYENTSLSSGSHTLSGTVTSGEVEVDAFESYSDAPDTDPPTPNPAAFTSTPSAISDTAISMTATGFDPSGPVEYFFDETSGNTGGSDSGWQSSTSYTDTGLNPDTQYTYTVQMRDSVPNTGTASGPASATTQSGGGSSISITNPSFESGTTGWSGATTSNSEFYSPVDGTNYATRSGGSGYTSQTTGHIISAGETFTLTIWARSTNGQGTTNATNAEARFYYGSTEITSVTQNVNPVRLSGAPRTESNDDGGNVWIDGGYRHEFVHTNEHLYQSLSDDPLNDPWSICSDSGGDLGGWAVGPVIVPGHKWLYGVLYDDTGPPNTYSEIRFIEIISGGSPTYTWEDNPTMILFHDGDEDPWVIDPHLYYDDDTGRLWMSWGGGDLWVSEIDPTDGMLLSHPSNKEFDAHPPGTHTKAVAWFNGDQWSDSWCEGPALYKHNGYWYYLACYGNLAENYTIRCGRGTSPTGPFYDKDGVNMLSQGNTLILGAEGGQNNPGHPHIWEENGDFYMGYDYTDQYDGSATDRFGIRKLYWVDDWPVVAYIPITVTFNADDYPAAIGQNLGISFTNTGTGSEAAFDYVSLEYTPSPLPTPDIDSNDIVNFVDYSLFTAQWMETDCNDCNGTDFSGDGNVDASDLDIFTDNWLRDYTLLGHWKLDGDANDYSGYGNDGILMNNPQWVDGQVGNFALAFDGDDSYIDLGSASTLKPELPVTLCAWLRHNDIIGSQSVIRLDDQSSGYYGIWLQVNEGKVAVAYGDGGGTGPANRRSKLLTTALNEDTWYHVAAVINGPQDMKIYLDGIDTAGTYSGSGSALMYSTNSSVIGTKLGPSNTFYGLIDDVRVYNRALSEDEIQQLAGM